MSEMAKKNCLKTTDLLTYSLGYAKYVSFTIKQLIKILIDLFIHIMCKKSFKYFLACKVYNSFRSVQWKILLFSFTIMYFDNIKCVIFISLCGVYNAPRVVIVHQTWNAAGHIFYHLKGLKAFISLKNSWLMLLKNY